VVYARGPVSRRVHKSNGRASASGDVNARAPEVRGSRVRRDLSPSQSLCVCGRRWRRRWRLRLFAISHYSNNNIILFFINIIVVIVIILPYEFASPGKRFVTYNPYRMTVLLLMVLCVLWVHGTKIISLCHMSFSEYIFANIEVLKSNFRRVDNRIRYTFKSVRGLLGRRYLGRAVRHRR